MSSAPKRARSGRPLHVQEAQEAQEAFSQYEVSGTDALNTGGMASTIAMDNGDTQGSILTLITNLLGAEGCPLDRALDALWRSYGGKGPTPPLYVCHAVYERFVAEGCSPGKLVKSDVMPPGKAVFFDPDAAMGAMS